MIKNIFETLLHIRKNHGDDEVIDKLMASALTHDMDGYWLAYRRIEVDLAKRGEDLGHKYSGLSKSITEAFKEVIREELKRIEGEHENSDYKKILKKLKGATLDIFGWEDNAA